MANKKMTWEERWNMHWKLNRKYSEDAMAALHRFMESENWSDWDEYMKLDKLANKHWGIHQAMFTKKYGKEF